jgi:FtsX-like permease family/MacB-like periplasmic core domain
MSSMERRRHTKIVWMYNNFFKDHARQMKYGLSPLLGVEPMLGRSLLLEEDRHGNHRVVVLSHSLWLRRFGGDPKIIGRSITLSNVSHEVIGVMPPSFEDPITAPAYTAQFWVPLAHTLEAARDKSRNLFVIGRLRAGVSAAQAQAEMAALVSRMQEQDRELGNWFGVNVRPLDEQRAGRIRKALWILLAAASFVLLIACVNVANLSPDLQESLRTEGRTMTGGRRQQRLRNLLVVSEIALALALLVGAGLLTRSFITLLRVNPGFVTERALALETMIGRNRNAEQRIALVEQTLPRVQSLPGVQSVGITSALPFHDNQVLTPASVKIEGRASAPGQDPTAYVINATPEYLRALGVPLLRGRELNQFDKADAAPVALVNNSMAVRHWPMEDPTGKKITFALSGRDVTCEIVGVVGDVRPNGLDTSPRLEIYLPYAQSPASLVTWVIRTTGDPLKELGAIKEKIREENPTQTFLSIATMDQLVDRTISQRRFNLMLLGSFAALALILAAVGLYGLISYMTAQRTHEIGLRMALGAQTGDVLKLVIGQGIKLALIGVLIGVGGALAVTRLMRSLLFGVSAVDPLTFMVVAVSLTLVALVACWLPARRATKVDPLAAIRYE